MLASLSRVALRVRGHRLIGSETLDHAPSSPLFAKVQLVPYGVLGTRLLSSGGIEDAADPPGPSTVIVDPAGLHHIQPPGGPRGAGGAAGAIYKWLGIHRDSEFPPDVVAAVTHTGAAKYHAYGDKHVIHAVGPNLRARQYTTEEAVKELAYAYANIFRECAQCSVPEVRLLPVSSGIFAGIYQQVMPRLTATALQEGFLMLSASEQQQVLGRDISLCIFLEVEFDHFHAEFSRVSSS